MKLLYCKSCGDVVVLRRYDRQCECGQVTGQYTDELNATYSGDAIPLGFGNGSFQYARRNQPQENGRGERFDAFVIPVECRSFVKIVLECHPGHHIGPWEHLGLVDEGLGLVGNTLISRCQACGKEIGSRSA